MTVAGHAFWYPVFCGLGDFDTKYGYEWNDRVGAYNSVFGYMVIVVILLIWRDYRNKKITPLF